ncbi:hypothetical protein Mapa_000009 [Marchantia paleacea]|nr:hypothetical protein Mapa_000009 [Marchantia paleacea]
MFLDLRISQSSHKPVHTFMDNQLEKPKSSFYKRGISMREETILLMLKGSIFSEPDTDERSRDMTARSHRIHINCVPHPYLLDNVMAFYYDALNL